MLIRILIAFSLVLCLVHRSSLIEPVRNSTSAATAVQPEIDLARLLQLRRLSSPLVIDVRPAIDFKLRHLPGAINIPASDIPGPPELQDKINTALNVVVYGTGDSLAELDSAVKQFASVHAGGVVLYRGGIQEWANAGLPMTAENL